MRDDREVTIEIEKKELNCLWFLHENFQVISYNICLSYELRIGY
jgi:hypothetical protein